MINLTKPRLVLGSILVGMLLGFFELSPSFIMTAEAADDCPNGTQCVLSGCSQNASGQYCCVYIDVYQNGLCPSCLICPNWTD